MRGGQNTIDLIGKEFGRLQVSCRAGSSAGGKAQWLCDCSCGSQTVVSGVDLRSGGIKSCGCMKREQIIARSTTHGQTGTPEFNVWQGMLARCSNPNQSNYENYGGRGISVCKRWRDSFQSFLDDVGPRPSPDLQIERDNNDGNYEPGNCRWATRSEQSFNRRPKKS